MSASTKRCRLHLRGCLGSGARLALGYARNVHGAVDRRMPEAGALTDWLAQNAIGFGLPDTVVPADDQLSGRWRRRGVSESTWRKTGAALAAATANMAGRKGGVAERWIAAIGHALALDPLEARILALALHYPLDRRIERLFDAMSESRGGPTILHHDASLFALLLDAPVGDVAARLVPSAKLLASGLMYLEPHDAVCVLERLTTLLRRDVPPTADIHEQLLGATTVEPLTWEAFAHLGPAAETAAAVLRAALCGGETGINILLYGPPGTGKTSFAATLAAHIGARIRSVAEADDDGDEPRRSERLAGLRLAQRLVVPGKTLLLFDEAEDLFVGRSRWEDEPVITSRVFIHRLLERVTVPVIWTANNVGVLGPAVVRRMTMCLELKVPGQATRARLWREMGDAEGIGLAEADAARLARLVPAAPAVACTALRATRLAGGDSETARLIVEGIARAVRGGELPLPEPEPDAAYDPALVNADGDLAALTAQLLRPDAPRAVSFLLSGPPGTGKSAWARHLAGRMGLPVLQKRASDLLNMFVGGTEQNIAAAFAEAREASAFLIFDEADSLLLERGDAVRSWEISQVNEMLTWMENHPLPFACTTNLPCRLDRASLRRFLVKLRFAWLTPAQARLAFRRFFGRVPPPELDGLHTLAPADFALVRRRAAVSGAKDPAQLMRLLAVECEGRSGGTLPIGFLAPGAA